MSKCNGCGADIKWVRMRGGVRADDFENLGDVFVKLRKNKVVVKDFMIDDEFVVVTGYTSHFATCPQADMFRKGGKSES